MKLCCMVRQDPLECSDRERPSVSPGSTRLDIGREDFCSRLGRCKDRRHMKQRAAVIPLGDSAIKTQLNTSAIKTLFNT